MTNLKEVKFGFNKYCGPSVLSILTGRSTDDCAAVISKINKQYQVAGVQPDHLLRAAEQMGFDTAAVPVSGYSLYRALTMLVNADGLYIIVVPQHFVVIEVQDKKIYFCDNHTKEPIPAASSARLGMEVLKCNRVTKNPDYKEPVPLHVVSEELHVDKYDTSIYVTRHTHWSDGKIDEKTIASVNAKSQEELQSVIEKLSQVK